jgi:hypothetical protein
LLSSADNDGANVGELVAGPLEGDLLITVFVGGGVTETGLLVGRLEGNNDNFCVGKLVGVRLTGDVLEVGSADKS